MQSNWMLYTNAKSEQNARVLLNKVRKYLPHEPVTVQVEGDRYSGHAVAFRLEHGEIERAVFLYQLLSCGERLANSWTLGAVTQAARGWSNRSRIAGILQMEWAEG